MYIGNQDSFKQRSKLYQDSGRRYQGKFIKCVKHGGVWNESFPRCTVGNRKNEDCIKGVNEE